MKFDRLKYKLHFVVVVVVVVALFYRLKPLTFEGGEETEVPGENP